MISVTQLVSQEISRIWAMTGDKPKALEVTPELLDALKREMEPMLRFPSSPSATQGVDTFWGVELKTKP